MQWLCGTPDLKELHIVSIFFNNLIDGSIDFDYITLYYSARAYWTLR